ncbi:riboflavin synthase [Desulfobacterium sp. N47]|uniref:Riboflavin synthase n=1 Tax=uncultured Desulfobacterium sp. TaxID=201089 RepID=E1YG44_9BACT|nr:Riboflavin synthase alpha chain [uncultured Desulfobacterium sp.]
MFTGIIESLGTISSIRSSGRIGKRLAVETDINLDGTEIGDSIAVNGACLTVVEIERKRFDVDVSPETLDKTILGNAKTGDRANIERALRLSDRLDGHLVSGHIDGIGKISRKKLTGNALIITFEVPVSVSRYIIKKGSVAVDGVSLTVNNCDEGWFEVSIIPHTAKLTTMGLKVENDPVNIETDMIGKYIERFVGSQTGAGGKKDIKSSIDMAFLSKTGFI